MKPFRFVFAALAAVLLLSGCATGRALMPGGVTPSDAEWHGVVAGPVRSLTAAVLEDFDPRGAVLARASFEVFGQRDPLGWLLPVSVVGEPSPRLVKCMGDFQDRCERFPANAVAHFAGTAEGRYWRPSRLTADD